MTPEQRKNRRIFLERWKTIPPENVIPGLEDWQQGQELNHEPTCQTIACAGGWCALMPEFQALGVTPNDFGAPIMQGSNYHMSVADRLFGHRHMFLPRDSRDGTGTDHEVVTRRFMKGLS